MRIQGDFDSYFPKTYQVHPLFDVCFVKIQVVISTKWSLQVCEHKDNDRGCRSQT